MVFSRRGIVGRLVLSLMTGVLAYTNGFAEIELITPADNTTTADVRPSAIPLSGHSGDMSIPAGITFSWRQCSNVPAASGYTLYISKDPLIDSSDAYIDGITDTFVTVFNLEIDRRYFWTVGETGTVSGPGTTPVYTFTTHNGWPRMIYIDGTTNVRDIGGRPAGDGGMIKQGLLFRSAEFNNTQNITDEGLAQLRRIGIVTEISLKLNNERPENVIPWLENYIRPLSNDGDGMALYVEGLRETPEVVAAVFHVLAQKEYYPVVVHCRMGSDRTGEIVAMLEAVLGCSYDQIVLNYLWSSLSTMGVRDTASRYWTDFVDYVKSFDPEGNTFEKGTVNFLLNIGVLTQEIETIRNIFLLSPVNTYSPLNMTVSRGGSADANHGLYRTVLHIHRSESRTHAVGGYKGYGFDLSGRCLSKTGAHDFRYGPSITVTGGATASDE